MSYDNFMTCLTTMFVNRAPGRRRLSLKTYHEAIHSHFSRNFVEHAIGSSAVGMQHGIQARLRWTITTVTHATKMLTCKHN